jgi:hypothetical protein
MENNPDEHIYVKRPPNCFMLWASDIRKDVSISYPNKTNSEISIILGELWHTLNDNYKMKYNNRAIQAKEEHNLKYPSYKYSPTKNNKNNKIKKVKKVKIIKEKQFKKPRKQRVCKKKDEIDEIDEIDNKDEIDKIDEIDNNQNESIEIIKNDNCILPKHQSYIIYDKEDFDYFANVQSFYSSISYKKKL